MNQQCVFVAKKDVPNEKNILNAITLLRKNMCHALRGKKKGCEFTFILQVYHTAPLSSALSRGEEKTIKSTEGSFHYTKTGTCCTFCFCPCPAPDSWNLDVDLENVEYTPVAFSECFALAGMKM